MQFCKKKKKTENVPNNIALLLHYETQFTGEERMTLFDFFAHSAENANTTSTRHVRDIVSRIVIVFYRLSTYYNDIIYTTINIILGLSPIFMAIKFVVLFIIILYYQPNGEKPQVDFRVFHILFALSSSAFLFVFFFFSTDAARYTIAAEFR